MSVSEKDKNCGGGSSNFSGMMLELWPGRWKNEGTTWASEEEEFQVEGIGSTKP